MVIVFYYYGIRFEHDSFPQLVTPMAFPNPPSIGDTITLYPSGKLAEIRKVDHHHMIIDVMPVQLAGAVA